MKKIYHLGLVTALLTALGAVPAKADITIASVGPMTGDYATGGDQMRKGAQVAVDEINARGGLLGQRVVLHVGDDVCDAEKAVAVAEEMARKGVVFVAGHWCSGASIPASAVYQREGILQISPGSTNPKYTDEGGPNVFRVCGRDDQQGKVAGALLAEEFAASNVGIVHDNEAYSRGLAEATKREMNQRGLQEVYYGTYKPGQTDYSGLIKTIKKHEIDALYVGGYHTEAALIVRQLRKAGLNTRLISGDALVTEEFWKIAGPAGAGTLMTFAPDPRKNPAAKAVVQRFRQRGIEPEGYVLLSYAAVQIFAQAVEQAGSTDLTRVLPVMHSKAFDTVMGKLRFDWKGDPLLPGYVFYEWHNGRYDYFIY